MFCATPSCWHAVRMQSLRLPSNHCSTARSRCTCHIGFFDFCRLPEMRVPAPLPRGHVSHMYCQSPLTVVTLPAVRVPGRRPRRSTAREQPLLVLLWLPTWPARLAARRWHAVRFFIRRQQWLRGWRRLQSERWLPARANVRVAPKWRGAV